MMMWNYGYAWNWGTIALAILQMIAWLGLLILIAYSIVRLLTDRDSGVQMQHSALEIARQRYARGEIDTPTFEMICTRLQSTHPNSTQGQENNGK